MSTRTAGISSLFTQNGKWLSDLIKRAFDIAVSAIVLVLFAPFFGLIALAIRRESPGPATYRGSRVGRWGKPFNILKFRTMYENPESYAGPSVTAQDDPRVTPLGRWLRDTKLNEFPQFWNVLVGDMSLVGPRPEDPSIAKTWPRQTWREVLSVRPGITSPASIQYHKEETLLTYRGVLQKYIQEVGPDKMRLDQLYVRYRSFWLDLDTLLWTSFILLPRVGSYSPPETLLFVGPITRLIRRHMSWLSIDMFVTMIAMGVTGVVWRSFGPLNVGWLRAIGMTASFALLFSLIGVVFGVNRIAWSKATLADAYNILPAWILAIAIAFFVNRWLGVYPSAMILSACALALGGFVFTRFRSRLITALLLQIMRQRGIIEDARERVLIVGSGRTAEHIAWLISHPTYSGKFQVVGFVDDDLMVHGLWIYGTKVLGACKDLPQLVKKYNVGLIILADHYMGYDEYCTITEICDSIKARVVVVPDIFGSLVGLISDAPAMVEAGNGREKADFRCQRCVTKYAPIEPEAQPEE